jgi:hypothetical protein
MLDVHDGCSRYATPSLVSRRCSVASAGSATAARRSARHKEGIYL